jgi:hypothetical protein
MSERPLTSAELDLLEPLLAAPPQRVDETTEMSL